MLAIIGASGKVGGAVLDAILNYQLLPTSQVVGLTSSQENDSKWQSLAAKGIQVRHASFDDASSMKTALTGCEKLFLVSTPQIALDFSNAVPGQGREKQHLVALAAAFKVGVKHVYYTSLAFQNPSKSNVMTAHQRTEAWLEGIWHGEGRKWTILREGLYNESWPLYLGHWNTLQDFNDRTSITVAGDGKISWTAIADLGLANAVIATSPSEEWVGKTVYLSNTQAPKTLKEIAILVGEVRKKKVELRVVSRTEHEKHYIEEKKLDEGLVKWWAATYDALEAGECKIDDMTLEKILRDKSRKPIPAEETIQKTFSN